MLRKNVGQPEGLRLRIDAYKAYIENAKTVLDNWSKLITDNVWLEYFWNKNMPDDRWINFEEEICTVIEKVDRSRYENNRKPISMDYRLTPVILNCLFPIFSQSRFITPETTYDEFKKRTLDDLNKLTIALSFYMYDIIDTNKLKQTPHAWFIDEVMDELSEANNKYVLNFNYTDTFEVLFQQRILHNENLKICHIHGKANANPNETNIVLGIDEYLSDEQLRSNVDFLEFRKYYQRINNETDNSYLTWIKELESSYKTKIIIGHSLGITDGDILSGFLNCKSIENVVCYYHSPKARRQQISNLTAILGKDALIRRMTGPNINISLINQSEEKKEYLT